MEFRKKFAFLRRREEFDAGLADEMSFHIEERADELEREGFSRAEALRKARIEFGPAARLAEETRGEWQWSWWEDLHTDLRYAARSLVREPGFWLVAVLSLGLGIGVNTAIFSLTMEALLSEPSVRDASSLAYVRLGGNSHIGLAQLQFIRDSRAFPGVAGLREDGDINWRNGEETRRLFAMRVTDNLFEMAGIPLRMGRGLQPGDVDTVVISSRMWRGKLASIPDPVGRTLILDGRPHRIVGLLPESHRTLFGYGFHPDVYVLALRADNMQLYVRMPEGIAPEAAAGQIRAVSAALDQAMPERDFKYADSVNFRMVTGLARLVSEKSISLFFGMLMTVVTLLLGIACLNVSGLLLARASSRVQEFAVRASLGAGRGRLVRQMLTESLLLALLGTAAGLLLNLVLTRLISGVDLQLPVPIVLRVEPDWRLLAYASAVATFCAVVVGLLSAWRVAGANAGDTLKQGEHQVGGKLALRRGLVIAQVAVSVVVLTTAVLFARNLTESVNASPGFDLDHTLYVSLRLVPENYPDAVSRQALAERAVAAISQVPGVVSAASSRMIPLNDDSTYGGSVRTSASPDPKSIKRHVNHVGPGYFRTMGVPLVAGREFQERGENEVIVNDTFARAAFPGISAVGQTVEYGGGPYTIVGVVKESKYAWMNDRNRAAVFERFRMTPGGGRNSIVNIMVRAGVDPETLVRPLLQSMTRLDGSSAVEVKPMRRAMGMALLPSRIGAVLLGFMGLLGLALTGIGLYGLMAYSVARRIREIGLRIALGAAPGRVLRLVFGEGAWMVGVGLALGLAASYFATRPLAAYFVEQLSTADPFTYILVPALMAVTGWLACARPARRALRVEPMEALRYE
ncbi:MAG TPA: ADOP family duplicated permease [Bryobacteraceae bacterium]|nr:ADOP family duplicated permease [Bryobacteraceae bacterium]